MMRRCDECDHWFQTGEAEGQCRRYAPQPTLGATQGWCFTSGYEWCGEFIPLVPANHTLEDDCD